MSFIAAQLVEELVDQKNIGEDFLAEYYEKEKVELPHRERRSKAEMDQQAWLEQAGRRERKKIERQPFSQEGRPEDFVSPPKWDKKETKECASDVTKLLFGGGPCSAKDRCPIRPLTEYEKKIGFYWRMLCDDAFQEDPKFKKVNFCWHSYNWFKWYQTLVYLFIQDAVGSLGEEFALQQDLITEITYADKTQHARIRAVKQLVKTIRASYDPYWDKAKVGEDQRLIFALCDAGGWCSWSSGASKKVHETFASTFADLCGDAGVQVNTPGKYQQRLLVYRLMKKNCTDKNGFNFWQKDLDSCFHMHNAFQGARKPGDYDYEALFFRKRCGYPFCPNAKDATTKEENLQRCSRCLVVRYCCKECQVKDWKEHKKNCDNLGKSRKDQVQIQELSKKYSSLNFPSH